MKNKLLRTLGLLIIFITFSTGVNCIPAHASWEIVSSDDGNILEIHTEGPGKLYDDLGNRFGLKYKHISIIGEMNDSDFGMLSLVACSEFKSIDLSAVETESILNCAFNGCKCLEKILCPANSKIIQKSFINCYNLKTVILPENLETICSNSFLYCENLELTIPTGVQVDEGAFTGCPKIQYTSSTKSVQKSKLNITSNSGPEHRGNLLMSLINWFKS